MKLLYIDTMQLKYFDLIWNIIFMFNKDTITLALQQNFIDKVSFLPRQCTSMCVVQDEIGFFVIDSRLASDTFNIVTTHKLHTEVSAESVKKHMNLFQAERRPVALWVNPQDQKYVPDATLHDCGLIQVESELGMAASIPDLKLTSRMQKLKIKEVQTQSDFRDYGQVMASVFIPYDDEACLFYNQAGLSYQPVPYHKMFIGYKDHQPVAIISCMKSAGIGCLYDVVTCPEYQHQGIGTAMVHAAIASLKQMGCSIVGLQASSEGIRLYKKIGFQSLGSFKVFSHEAT